MGIQVDADVPNCSECGAFSHDGLTCQERLCGMVSLERTDPEMQSLHFLTVAAYNLQHPAQFTSEAVECLRRSFAEYLVNKIPIDAIKQQGQEFNGPKCVLRPALERTPVLRSWEMTTADVFLPFQPQGTAERVKKWIESVHKDV
jgi:hypothetical protein